MILVRTVLIPDLSTGANVVEALAGPGGPAGILECRVDGATISVRFASDRTSPDLIDALIALESTPAASAPIADVAVAAAIAARGLHDPELDSTRIIETYLP